MDKNKYLNKVVSVTIKGNTCFQGVFLNFDSKWSLLKFIPVDYVLDGFVLINNNYISAINVSEDDSFTNEVVKLKTNDFGTYSSLNLKSDLMLFNDIRNEINLIKIELKDHYKSYVGKITEVKEKNMKVYLLDARCNWLKEEIFLYKEIRAIYFKDDYLDSLQLYLNSKDSIV